MGNASHIYRLRVERFVPGWVEPTHSGGKVRPVTVLGGDIPGVLGYTVIHPVNSFNEFLIEPGQQACQQQGNCAQPCTVLARAS